MKPPGVRTKWESCDLWTKALLIAYEQIRGIEEQEQMISIFAALFGSGTK